jgi:hypothetical protein
MRAVLPNAPRGVALRMAALDIAPFPGRRDAAEISPRLPLLDWNPTARYARDTPFVKLSVSLRTVARLGGKLRSGLAAPPLDWNPPGPARWPSLFLKRATRHVIGSSSQNASS